MLNQDIEKAKIVGFHGYKGRRQLPYYHMIQIELDGKLYEIKPSNPEATMILKRCTKF
jgi:hypothetical protein